MLSVSVFTVLLVLIVIMLKYINAECVVILSVVGATGCCWVGKSLFKLCWPNVSRPNGFSPKDEAPKEDIKFFEAEIYNYIKF